MLHWRRIKVYARSVWDVIIIITAFCLANDGHLLFSAQWLQKPLRGSWWEVLTRGWLIYWAPSSPSSSSTELALGFACFHLSVSSLSSSFFSFLCSMSLYFQPTFTHFCTSFYALHLRAVLYLEAAIALIKGNDEGINEVNQRKSFGLQRHLKNFKGRFSVFVKHISVTQHALHNLCKYTGLKNMAICNVSWDNWINWIELNNRETT